MQLFHGEFSPSSLPCFSFLLVLLGVSVTAADVRHSASDLASRGSIGLEQAKTIQQELAGGQSHEYHFSLQAGDYARLAVNQRSTDVAVSVFQPDGGRL